VSIDLQDKYLPELYNDITDIEELMDTQSQEVNDLWDEVYSLLDETFIDDASQVGIGRWEGILGISPSAGATLSTRRNNVKLKLYVKNKANFTYLASVVTPYATLNSVTFNSTTSTVEIDLEASDMQSTIYIKVREIIPSHLLIEYTITTSEAILGLTDSIYGIPVTRNTKLGTWQLGSVPFAAAGVETQYK